MLAIALKPGGILAWLLIGLIAGAIAGRVSRGRGYGCLGDIVVGLIGAFVGGLVLSDLVSGNAVAGFIGTFVVALIGALILITGLALIRRIL